MLLITSRKSVIRNASDGDIERSHSFFEGETPIH
jgi:hypothetical protein